MSHVLSLLVEDKPGLLTRVAGLFSRRGFNIESLAVGKSEIEGLSRITVVVDVEELPLEQVTKQLNKLINVIKIVELDPEQSVLREHLLIKVRVDNATRSQVLEAVNLFRARVVDVATDALVIEVTGDSGKVEALLRVLEPYGIKEIAQSGLLAIGRGIEVASPTESSRTSSPSGRRKNYEPHNETKERNWLSSTTTRTPTSPSSRARRSPSSATARRVTRTRRTSATPASR